MKKSMSHLIRKYFKETSAATAIAFALAIPVVVGSAGFATDLSMAHMVKKRLSHALDAAALAAAGMSGTDEEISAKVNQFFYKNYPPNLVGAPYDVIVTVSGDDIQVSAKADYDTTFAKLLGIDQIDIGATTTVTREILGLEVAMILDVTGSMNENNNIETLRVASKNFLNTLCKEGVCSSLVKIGIVPFANTVNVGPYGLGKKPDNSVYDTAFMNNPKKLTFNQSYTKQWWGCILERAAPEDTMNSTSTWKWDMYNYSNTNPNQGCNKSYLLPLSNNYTAIKSKIDSLYAAGHTLSNLGMVWGYRVLSPEAPFKEGTAWDDAEVKKVALLMTDGDNNIGETYSGYGVWSNLKLTDHDLDVKLAATCEKMKADGITIYTVTFTSGINEETKSYFRNCASDETKYHDAPSQDDLLDAFDAIARELSNIHLKG